MIRYHGEWSDTTRGMQKEMERLLNYLGNSKPPSVHFARMWEPAADVYVTATEVVVLMELAGVRRDEIEIVVDGDTLVVRGNRKETAVRDKRSYYRMEIHRGPFERRVILPARVDSERTEASYQDGLLGIVLPKLRQERTLRVNVKSLD
jgi:HSP20 family protein